MQDRQDQAGAMAAPSRGSAQAHAPARTRRDDIHRLLEEMRALVWILPGVPLPEEADEADFDNMPV